MRPRKITDEKLPLLIGVAKVRLRAQAILAEAPVNKQLAYEIGVKPAYLHNVMHRLTSIMRICPSVPHETLRRALFNDNEFKALMDTLNARAQRRASRAQSEGEHSAAIV